MVSFDFFSQPQGPQIDIDLFPKARESGARTGNAIKTPLQAGIEGAIQGIQNGFTLIGQYQQNEIRQNQIEQQPVINRQREAETRRLELQNEIGELNNEVLESNKDLYLETKKAELEGAKAKAEQELADVKIGNSIAQDLNDPTKQAQILNNPAYSQYLIKNPKQYEYVVGTLYSQGVLSDQQTQEAFARINLEKSLQIKAQEEKNRQAKIDEFRKDADEATKAVRTDGVLGTALPGFTEEDSRRVQVFPKGVVQVDPKTKKINKSAKQLPFNPANKGQYDLFIDDTLSSFSSDISDRQATNIGKWKDSYSRYNDTVMDIYGIPRDRRTKVQDPNTVDSTEKEALKKEATAEEATQGRLKSFESIETTTAAEFGDKAAVSEILTEARTAGKERSLAGRIIDSIAGASPLGISEAPSAGSLLRGEVPPVGMKANELVNVTAAEQAAKDIQNFNSGDQETKDAYREWSKQNGVPLRYSDLKNFYAETARQTLNKGYEEAYALGARERDQDTRAAAAKDAINNSLDLKGITAEQAVKVRQNANAAGDALNLPKAKTKEIAARAERVVNNELLTFKPPYVKAVAMQESGGRNNAVSPTKVVGPMQVTSAVADSYGLNKNDPEQNIQAGQLYLEDLFRQFNGAKELAYAAYNAGPGVVAYAQKLAGGSSNWEDVRQHMLEALTRYQKYLPKGVTPRDKLKEVYNYPNTVTFNESLFQNVDYNNPQEGVPLYKGGYNRYTDDNKGDIIRKFESVPSKRRGEGEKGFLQDQRIEQLKNPEDVYVSRPSVLPETQGKDFITQGGRVKDYSEI